MSIRRPVIDPEKLVATRFNTVAEKARFGEDLIRFIETGFKPARWTKPLYRQLSQTFGFIANYDAYGFWDEHFSTTEAKLRFLFHILRWDCPGSPEHTFCDVEKMVQDWIKEDGTVGEYQRRLETETEVSERAQLARLKAKYDKEL